MIREIAGAIRICKALEDTIFIFQLTASQFLEINIFTANGGDERHALNTKNPQLIGMLRMIQLVDRLNKSIICPCASYISQLR